jgi:hypothetical protein
MKCKGKAHETLSLVFQGNGVLQPWSPMTLRSRLRESSDANSRKLTPYYPWQQVADLSRPNISTGQINYFYRYIILY